ncbi:MarR family winged helix-turn-helix transcriptional regulator [Shewanella sp. UCD-KL12]|uniref:MarR family winged helix-turn-helix transcriptional regulator n=1 Tax=Shewanella sp. UCD-KL12 TaxID=1917163 RepID=UPI0009F9972F|nr:MarR family winged helix-turn-helix transcriptional regulator [Shewanella sp. UCD-KL12]
MNQHIAAEQDDSSLSLNQFLPYRLVNLAQNVSDKFAEVYQVEFNLTVPEWRILVHLAQQPNSGNAKLSHVDQGISAKALTVLASMDKSTVSRAVKLMLDKGYLVKQIDSKDKRASLLELTPKGKQLYLSIAPKALEWEAGLLDAITASEYRDLMRIIEKLDSRLT